MKFVIVLMLVGIVLSLGSALTSMTRGPTNTKAMANALTVRIGLSTGLAIMLVVAWALGLIEPRGS